MTARTASCPACGAAITFRWAQAVQTTCAYCQAVSIRTDLDLELLGTQSVLPLTPSPIQLGTTGRWDGQPFEVVGRLVYRYGRGGWNEWHCVSGDRSLWLGDAQLDYTLTDARLQLALAEKKHTLGPGDVLRMGDERWTVRSRTVASYAGSEGELPFRYFGVTDVPFIDFAGDGARFATLDLTEEPSILFTGRYVTPAELSLANLRTFEGW